MLSEKALELKKCIGLQIPIATESRRILPIQNSPLAKQCFNYGVKAMQQSMHFKFYIKISRSTLAGIERRKLNKLIIMIIKKRNL